MSHFQLPTPLVRHMKLTARVAALALLTLAPVGAKAACRNLARFVARDARITAVTSVLKGAPIELSLLRLTLPAPIDFCRVSVTLTPTADSVIRAQIWLPDASQWNGKFLGSGNGGFGGTVQGAEIEMRKALAKGYAAAGDNLGHEMTHLVVDGTWAIGHPQKVKDFAYRADHVTAVFAKRLIAAYYGRAPRLSYFSGCSNGGHEALMEAQRFPTDYDGIIAGAPANAWTHLMADFLWNERALHAEPGSRIPKTKLALIQKAVLARCDRLDGVEDGIIDNPMQCHFNPTVLACKGPDRPNCLTRAQVEALRRIYSGPVDPETGKRIYPGFAPGYEALPENWDLWITGKHALQAQFANQFFGSFIYSNPHWNDRRFDFHKDLPHVDAEIGPIINSNDPNLSAFAARGGKLILFQGWADAAVSPWGTIDYYLDIRRTMGRAAAHRFVRLFMVPDMMHCGGGPAPNVFDALAALNRWRAHGQAPERMVASLYASPISALAGTPGRVLSTRPICAYPAVRHWIGRGSYNQARNYVCRPPGHRMRSARPR